MSCVGECSLSKCSVWGAGLEWRKKMLEGWSGARLGMAVLAVLRTLPGKLWGASEVV